jgi:hypothetical protein
MQEEKHHRRVSEMLRETRFFLAMAKTGPYIGLEFVRGGIFPS